MSLTTLPTGGSASVGISHIDDLVHEGKVFQAYLAGTIGSAEVAQIAITPPANGAHLNIKVVSEKIGVVTVTEAVTSLAVASGASFTPVNRRRTGTPPSAASTVMTGYTGANFTYSGGTLIDKEQIPTNGTLEYSQELVIKGAVPTVIKLTAGAASCDFSIKAVWYEPRS